MAWFGDRLVNLVTGLGTAKDKTVRSRYVFTPLDPNEALAAYRTDWIARKVIDIPAMDMVREGRNWQAEQNQIEALEAEERRLQVWAKLARAIRLARLYGGSALILGTGDVDPSQPLNPASVGRAGLRFIHVASRWDITTGQIERDPASPFWGEPVNYTMSSPTGQVILHPSRVIPFIGAEVPDIRYQDGWGDSVLQVIDEAVKAAGLTASGIAHLVQEAKVDVFKIPDFLKNVGDEDYRRRVLTRVGLANEAKSIANALLMDAGEGYEQKTINFGQLPEILRLYLQIAAGAADIPATRLLGQSPDGMNATGIGDMKNYHDRLKSDQEAYLRPRLDRLDEVLIRSALGDRPAEVYYEFAPLEQMSEREKAEIFKMRADAARTLAGTGGTSPSLLPIEALSEALVNAMVEAGDLPGLEAAMEEYGALGDQPDDGEDVEAALTPVEVNIDQE